jgi:diguanylate cyclase (GGDEF)-like protein
MTWTRVRASVIVLLVVSFAAVLVLSPGGPGFTGPLDDIAATTSALIATCAAGWRASRLQHRARLSWALMTAAFAAAALGQGAWGWYEIVLSREVPYPSFADAAYLCFPVLALAGLLLRPASALVGQGRTRSVLDGILLAGSMFNLSWVTALGATYDAGGDSSLAFVISLAYPVTDLVLVTVTVVVLAQAQARRVLVVLAAGLLMLCVADSAYSYLTTLGTFQSGNLTDVGYVLGYLLLAEAAIRDRTVDAAAPRPASVPSMLLPYLPAVGGVGIGVWQLGAGLSNPAVLVGGVLVVVLFLRQLLTLLENHRLVGEVITGQAALSFLAFHDPLTSLANRALFEDRLEHAVALRARNLQPLAVLLADLDDFTDINDTHGHQAGDEVLREVAERMLRTTRAADTVARLGGDEFAVLVQDGEDAWRVAQRILQALDEPIEVNGKQVPMSASIGVASVDTSDPALTAVELLKRADLAMYAAKRRGKASVARYELGSADALANELELRTDLVAAVADGTLDVHYQPILAVTGELVGFEALCRWSRRGEQVAPAVFIPVAERAGVLAALDHHVLTTALEFAATFGEDLLLNVNIGVDQLVDPALPARIRSALETHRLAAGQLVIEIPENRLLPDRRAADSTVAGLRADGVRLALDDFGAGWSSLARLQELAPDIVKIDRCFVAPLTAADAPTDIVAGIIELAHQLGASVVAEGIEHPQQLETLRRLGCDAVQGFLLGRPMPVSQATQLVGQQSPRAGRSLQPVR